ncbi:MAG TPA: amino acid adenylation domain-containing protein, partial [Thermoanaerobaculia bacterium]
MQTLLGRLTGQEDLLVGSPTTGRRDRDLDGVAGYFVNPLVLRAELAGDPCFAELLARAHRTVTAGLEHRDLPLAQLTRRLQAVRDPGRPPVFQVLFVLQQATPEQEPGLAAFAVGQAGVRVELEGLALESLRLDRGTSQLDLTLSAAEVGDTLALSCEYDTALFDGVTIGRWLGHLRTLLAAATARPESRLGELDLLTAEETLQLRAWNETATTYPLERPLHAWIEEQAGATPEAVAVVFEGEELTYGELDRRANRLAHRLRARSCGPESRVGVLLERSCELLVALLGILKAGAAYVPLDPEHPAERLAFLERDARLRLVLTRRDLAGRLPADRSGDLSGGGDRLLFLEPGEPAAGDPAGETRPAVPVDPDCPAYVLYTSGSTGRPKGVVISHRAIANRLLWMQDALRLSAADRVLQKTPFSFDVSVWELFWPLMTGARLVVAVPGGHRDNAYLARLVAEEGITVLHFVPSMLQLFLEEPGVEACRSLRDVVCSGEALPPELARRFAARLGAGIGQPRLHNLYGPTEAAVDVTSWVCGEGDDRASVPIGRPIANTRIHLLGPGLLPVPVGVPGELFIAGVNLARGYVDRPDLTAERFLPDPLGEGPGERVYRTGDLARRRSDGAIEFLGRLDHQVKIRSVRVELGEIEAALDRHPAVAQSVAGVDGEGGDRRLIAHLLLRPGAAAPGAAELRGFLRAILPDAMVPSAFVPLSAFPLTASGKVDRKALPAPVPVSPPLASGGGSELERTIAGLWSEALGVPQVGLEDNFFDLGGHSMLLQRVQLRLREATGREVSLLDLLTHATVRSLARHLDPGETASAPAASAPGTRVVSGSGAIAIVGMSGRFPGAPTVGRLWENLCA